MKQTERNALVKVLKNRFEILRKQGRRLRDDLKRAIYERTIEENERAIQAAKRDMAKIQERAKKLEEDARAVVVKHREKGLRLGSSELRRPWHRDARTPDELYVELNDIEGSPVEIKVYNNWYPDGVDQRVERELANLEREHDMGQIALAKKESALIEEVLLGGIEDSVTAQEFLDKVPTLDILPSPEQVRQLAR